MQNKIKALLLAAGYGTRLRPITDQIPKCLIEIGGITMLERWLKSLEKVACNEAVINTHYLAQEVDIFLEKTRTYPFKIHKIHELHKTHKIHGTPKTSLGDPTEHQNAQKENTRTQLK